MAPRIRSARRCAASRPARAGAVVRVGEKELGLGVVNPRSETVETAAAIRDQAHAALRHVPPERVFLNPDCGFGTFAARPMNSPEVAALKLEAMVEAARMLREESVVRGA